MDKYLEQIMALRQALKDADLADEEREVAEEALKTIEAGLKEREVEEEKTEKGETEERAPAAELDLSPIVETFESVGRAILEGQTAVLDEIKTMREESAAREVEEETEREEEESREASDATARVEKSLADMRKLITDAMPLRRGEGPGKETTEEPLDEAAQLERDLKDIENPEMRLRYVLNHVADAR